MKKAITISLVLVLSMMLAGCGKKKQAVEPGAKPSEPQGGMLIGEADNSLLGWLKRGQGVECTIEDAEGQTVVQSKGGNVRMAGIPYVGMDAMATGSVDTDMSGVSLTTGDWVYMWSEQDKKGTKMNIKKLEALAPENEEAEEPATWDETVADWEDNEVQYNCEDKDLSDDLFSPPDDVEFSDLTDFLLGIGDMAQQLGGQMPAGEGLDLDALEQQAKELQEKYGIEE